MLVGNVLAQTPEHVVTAGVEWDPNARWKFGAQLRYNSSQFEDDQNSRSLAAFAMFNLVAVFDVNDHVSATFRVENVFDTPIETGRSADGLVAIGPPRLLTLQFRFAL